MSERERNALVTKSLSDHLLTPLSTKPSLELIQVVCLVWAMIHLSLFVHATTYTTNGVGSWDANGAPANPLLSGDIVNVNHAGVFFDWPNTVVLQSGSTFNINDGGNIQLLNLTIDAGATMNLNTGGDLASVGWIVNNSNAVVIDGDLVDNSNFTNNGSITGTGSIDVDGTASGTGTINGTSMSVIDFGSGPVDISQPLPVELLYFSVKYQNQMVEVKWATDTEINNNYFTIERSSDGIHWKEIAKIHGAGNSSGKKYYKYYDREYLTEWSYYRLKQTDYDGSSETFESRAVFTKPFAHQSIVAYPNPINRGGTIQLTGGKIGNWQLHDANGRVCREGSFDDSLDTIQTNNLEPGIYCMVFHNGRLKIVII